MFHPFLMSYLLKRGIIIPFRVYVHCFEIPIVQQKTLALQGFNGIKIYRAIKYGVTPSVLINAHPNEVIKVNSKQWGKDPILCLTHGSEKTFYVSIKLLIDCLNFIFLLVHLTFETNFCSRFYLHGATLVPVWISNCIHYKMWDEIIYPFPTFNGATVEVWESTLISSYALEWM